MRVFAGPNGSGKSTIIAAVRSYEVNEKALDFGIYINADDLAKALMNNGFSFADYQLETSETEFVSICLDSGLINTSFDLDTFQKSFKIDVDKLFIFNKEHVERLAQILAHFLRKKLLAEKRKLSFETVFSHSSKLEIMQEAKEAGYKVYLYFVSTESPEINKFRVEARVKKGGHDVPPDKIENRYYNSLDLLFDAAQLAYQAFFFDNSKDGAEYTLFASFKQEKGKKTWDIPDESKVPEWFRLYYLDKVKPK
ncbi:MAG: zeta toxin family protein [Cytophagales bacterium]